MLNIGRKQKLVVVKKVEFGIYLGETREAGEKERVLLPIKQVPEGTKEGDELEVFLYRDSSDRLIATTREPKLVLGELAVLNVAATGKIGAFLDWGLEKDEDQRRNLHLTRAPRSDFPEGRMRLHFSIRHGDPRHLHQRERYPLGGVQTSGQSA